MRIARRVDSTSATNMAWVHKAAGRVATFKLINFPASRSRVRNGSQPASRAVRRRYCSLPSSSWGSRNVAVSDSRSVPRYRCVRVGLRSHFLTEKEISVHERYQHREVNRVRRCELFAVRIARVWPENCPSMSRTGTPTLVSLSTEGMPPSLH